jgi:hypothetical protein
MRYSREGYENAEEKLHDSEDREKSRADRSEQASELAKFADVSYENVANVLDFLRGDTVEQSKKKLTRLYDQAYDDAIELNTRHEALEAEASRAWSQFEQSIDRLERFEAELLSKAEKP